MKIKTNILIVVIALFNIAPITFGATELTNTIVTTVPSATEISAINIPLASGVITPATGVNSTVQGQFSLKTNGSDSQYDFILTSQTHVVGSDVNSYFQAGGQNYIILGSNATTLYPTAAAINDIKSGSPTASLNANAIAYPISATQSGLSSISMQNSATYGGLHYKVTTGGSQTGTISQAVGATPFTNTYSLGADKPGTYQAILTFSAIRKP